MTNLDDAAWIDKINLYIDIVVQLKSPYNGFLSYQWITTECMNWYPLPLSVKGLARVRIESGLKTGIMTYVKKAIRAYQYKYKPHDGYTELQSVYPEIQNGVRGLMALTVIPPSRIIKSIDLMMKQQDGLNRHIADKLSYLNNEHSEFMRQQPQYNNLFVEWMNGNAKVSV